MEELQSLVNIVKDLPTFTVWVLLGFLLYKLSVIGSIYGLLRLVVIKIHDWSVTPKHLPTQLVEYKFDNFVISDRISHNMVQQLKRLLKDGSSYISQSDVNNLEDAINDYMAKKNKVGQ